MGNDHLRGRERQEVSCRNSKTRFRVEKVPLGLDRVLS